MVMTSLKESDSGIIKVVHANDDEKMCSAFTQMAIKTNYVVFSKLSKNVTCVI